MTAKKTVAKKTARPSKTPSIGDIVTYCLPQGEREIPAIVTAVDKGQACLTVFETTGPYVTHDVKHGAKAGCWH
jgi:hypothetical protein